MSGNHSNNGSSTARDSNVPRSYAWQPSGQQWRFGGSDWPNPSISDDGPSNMPRHPSSSNHHPSSSAGHTGNILTAASLQYPHHHRVTDSSSRRFEQDIQDWERSNYRSESSTLPRPVPRSSTYNGPYIPHHSLQHHLTSPQQRAQQTGRDFGTAPVPSLGHNDNYLASLINENPTTTASLLRRQLGSQALGFPSASTAEAQSAFDYDRWLRTDENETMPPRHPQRLSVDGTIDLTADSSPAVPRVRQPASRRNLAQTSTTASPSTRPPTQHRPRSRSAGQQSSSVILEDSDPEEPTTPATHSANETTPAQVEHLDLTQEGNQQDPEPIVVPETVAANASVASSIAAQQQTSSDSSDGPVRLGKRQCIICMEPYTNMTTTHCGHIFCHECLTQALQVGEKNNARGVGNCPVCRKPVSRSKPSQVIPIAFMKRSAYVEKWWLKDGAGEPKAAKKEAKRKRDA